jgi:Family of unknown function (DUF6325)
MTTPSAASIGPVELLVVKFPGNQFKGEIAPALVDLVDSGTIRIVDLLFAIKDEEGNFDMVDVKELEAAELAAFEPLLTGGTELLSQEDVEDVAAMIEPNSSAAVMLFENTWATKFRNALNGANAELIYNVRIPQTVIQQLMKEQAEAAAYDQSSEDTAETTA